MGLTDLFSKLIIEHGSAEVQAKHIALFKDQLALADKKTTELESEVSDLKSKLEVAESDFQKSQKDNEELRSKIQEYEKTSHETPIDDPKVKILAFLSDNEASTSDEVAYGLNLKLQLVKYHLEELYNSHMVDQEHNPLGGNWWSLNQPGRKYLIDTGILA